MNILEQKKIETDLDKYDYSGNAMDIVNFIKKELPIAAWNMIAVKCMRTIVKYKINAMKIKDSDYFPTDLVQEINNVMSNMYHKNLKYND